MALRKLGKDRESRFRGSPGIYLGEAKDSSLMQGLKVEDIKRLAQMDVPGHESEGNSRDGSRSVRRRPHLGC
jgi:hypothetical protein